MTPHPQRCETCTNCNQKKIHARYDKFDTYEFFCNKYQVWIFGTAYNTLEIVGCASHSSASEPVPDSTTLIEMAEREWHSREERRGIHDKVPWTTGWMSGYLSSVGDIQQAREQERERVLAVLGRNFSGRYVQDAVAEILLFPETLWPEKEL
jgi:hypothetical protein